MRKDRLYVVGTLVLACWAAVTYFLYFHRPRYSEMSGAMRAEERRRRMERDLRDFEQKLGQQLEENKRLLEELDAMRRERDRKKVEGAEDEKKTKEEPFKDFDEETGGGGGGREDSSSVVAVLMFACNRPSVARALDSLLAHRDDPKEFPIIVSQDCGHAETKRVILSYGSNVTLIEQPDLSEPDVPPKEKKFKGYFKIARHYGWALGQIFDTLGYEQAIIVEDDLEFSPDFFDYFRASLPVLKTDPTLFCVSAWNDNGKEALIDQERPDLLYRTDFFGGLGWMFTSKLWKEELSLKWPRSYWDDWMREPGQRRGRACIRPEISRTKTFGKVGVSNGLFYDKHLKYIKLNDRAVDFGKRDLGFLRKGPYDAEMTQKLMQVPVVSLEQIRTGDAAARHKEVRLLYHTKTAFKTFAKVLGIMDDFKSGVPRMAYRGVVSTMYRGLRVHVAPNLNWKGYDPKW